jgi:hypothetical protein
MPGGEVRLRLAGAPEPPKKMTCRDIINPTDLIGVLKLMTDGIIDKTNCLICSREVSLKECKLDERGRAVHEECYVLHVKKQTQSVPSPPSRPTSH